MFFESTSGWILSEIAMYVLAGDVFSNRSLKWVSSDGFSRTRLRSERNVQRGNFNLRFSLRACAAWRDRMQIRTLPTLGNRGLLPRLWVFGKPTYPSRPGPQSVSNPIFLEFWYLSCFVSPPPFCLYTRMFSLSPRGDCIIFFPPRWG